LDWDCLHFPVEFSLFRVKPSKQKGRVVYQLYIANKNYSSWSLRPWILMRELGIEFEECMETFESPDNFEKFRSFSPAGTVPCLVDDGRAIWDSLAIAEYLAERHEGVLPPDEDARAFARCVTAEMHSSFSSLRNICPMNCAITVVMNEVTEGLQRDITRIDEIWQGALQRFGGPFLGGATFGAVDAFFCPVAFRVQSYLLPLSPESAAYGQRLLDLAGMQAWYEDALRENWREESHEEEARAVGTIVEDRRQD